MKVLLERWELERNLVAQGAEIWLDNTDVRNLLHASDATIYRQRNEGVWVCKKVGGKWFYLKSLLYAKSVCDIGSELFFDVFYFKKKLVTHIF